ncbi:MAG TPA: ABC transporter substrate-binding protein, partial [Acidimicrobiia bacterium]|nr:ABC transporter substrate-binding protein [Acidimicrobiia bacterium]
MRAATLAVVVLVAATGCGSQLDHDRIVAAHEGARPAAPAGGPGSGTAIPNPAVAPGDPDAAAIEGEAAPRG